MVFDSRAARLRVPREAVRVRLDELMTFAGLILWVVQAYIDDSGFGVFFGTELGKLIRYFCLLLFLARILLSDMHLAARAISAAAVFFCYLMMIQKMAGAGIKFLQLFVIIMAIRGISFKRICRVMFWSCLFCYAGVLFFDHVGLIRQLPLVDGDRVRYYMGFRFVSFASFYIFNLFFCGAYAYTDMPEVVLDRRGRRVRRRLIYRNKFPLWGLALLMAVNAVVYVRTNTNIPFLIMCLFVFLYLICVYGGLDLFPDVGLMRFLAGICYPALAAFTYWVVKHYNANSTLWVKLDDRLTHFRIRHAAEGLKRYGIHLFGQVVVQNGDLQSPNYFYIDSAYMKILINYGIVFAVILLAIYAMISVAAVRSRDTVLCIWMVCIAGYSLMNNVLLDPEQNCSLFALWYAVGIWQDQVLRRGGGRMAGPVPGAPPPGSYMLPGTAAERICSPEKVPAPQEMDSAETAEGSDRPAKISGPERPDGPEKSVGPEKTDVSEKPDTPEKSDTPEKPVEPEKSGMSGKPGKGPSLKINFLLSMAYQVLLVLLPMITTPYLARVLGAAKSGIYSFTASYQTYFSMFAALGTVTYGAREIARNRLDRAARSRLFWEIELMSVGTSTVSILAFILFILTRDRYQVFYIPQIMAIAAVMFDISWFFTGIEEFKYTVTKNALFKLAGVVLIFLLVKSPDDLLIYIIILSASTMLGNLTMWLYIPKFLDPVDFKDLRIRRHFRETMVYFIPTIATSVYTVLDKTLIGEITRDEQENGYYDKVVQLINIMKALTFTALNSVLGVRISFLYAQKKFEEIRKRIVISINYILFIGLGICFGLSGIAPRFIPWFLGPGYERSITMLILMSPIVVIIGVSNCLGSQYYTPAGRRAQSARFIIAGSCVNLVLNLLLIPRYWGYGAIAASLAAELTVTALYVAFSGESFSALVLLRDGWKKLLSAVAMFLLIRLIDPVFASDFIAVAAEILLGGTAYVVLLFILRDTFMTGFCVDLVRGFLHRKKA